MKKEQGKKDEMANLRAMAEKKLNKKIVKLRRHSADDLERILHELSVHEIELEMQNEQLNDTQLELEQSCNKYADLYDFAPVGYFVLDKNGIIRQVNLTGAAMVGIERRRLLEKPFSRLLKDKDDQDMLYITCQKSLREGICSRCDMKMLSKGGCEFYVEFLIDPMKDKDDKIVGSRVALIDISKRKEAEQRLLSYQEQLRRLSSELSLSEEKIRKQVALRVHDEVAQNLAIAKLRLDSASAELSPVCDVRVLDQIGTLLDQAVENIRSLVNELSVPILYEIGFIPSLQWLTENMEERFGLKTEFNDDGQDKPLSQDMQVLLFHAIRELLINVVKHAGAKKVTVTTESEDGHICIKVSDDGKGFDFSKTYFRVSCSGGFGLFSIRESLGSAGGSLEIESAPGKGTTAVLKAPLEVEVVARDSGLVARNQC